jgi:hypothetical protein
VSVPGLVLMWYCDMIMEEAAVIKPHTVSTYSIIRQGGRAILHWVLTWSIRGHIGTFLFLLRFQVKKPASALVHIHATFLRKCCCTMTWSLVLIR